MVATRYTRDEIISQGLDLVSSPTISQHDMPGGIVQPNAFAIKWLQNALDMFHRKYPFSSDFLTVTLTLSANTTDPVLASDATKYIPTDFVIDVRDGVVAAPVGAKQYRLRRRSFQYWLQYYYNSQNSNASLPLVYTVASNRIRILPQINQTLTLYLWYYGLPTALDQNDPVNFPDEFVLIEFIRLKALEWTRSIDPGTAQSYLTKQLAGFRASGLLNEPEYEDGIPLENNQIINDSTLSRNNWMGGFPGSA